MDIPDEMKNLECFPIDRSLHISPGELHPEALTEPCLSLSAHTALAIQRERTLSPQRPSSSSCCQLPTRSWLQCPVPFAPRALPRFITTTTQSAPETPHPYSRPRGSSTCSFSVNIGISGSHVPFNCLMASSGHLSCRTPLRP